jgi:hypothetical protein
MGFGRNTFAAKAEAAEQKAEGANDQDSQVRMYLEATHLWAEEKVALIRPRRFDPARTALPST